MPKSIYVNLPVADLAASTRFYEALGFVRNPQFSSAQAASMAWSDAIHIQLLAQEYFATFTTIEVADAHQTCQVMLALTRDSRADVDAMAQAAASAGGKADIRGVVDFGWLYNRAFSDPDGHALEAAWIDLKAMSAAAA